MAKIDVSDVSKFFRESGMAKNALNAVKSNEETWTQKVFRGARERAEELVGGTRVGDAMLDTSAVRGKAKGEKVLFNMKNPEHKEAAFALREEAVGHSNTIRDAKKALEEAGQTESAQYEQLVNQEIALRGEKGNGGMIGDITNAIQNEGTFGYEKEATMTGKIKNFGGQVKDYYTNGEASDVGIKAGVTAGAYAGLAVGARYLSGGTLTTNNNGESDIAGIPFI